MYFPYIRGKRFDLIALRELVQLLNDNQELVSPIIEPVKNNSNLSSTSTLRSTLEAFTENNVNFNIVVNPLVGDFQDQSELLLELISDSLRGYSNFQIGIMVNEHSNYLNTLEQVQTRDSLLFNGFTLIHTGSVQDLDSVMTAFGNVADILNNVVDFGKTDRRYYRNFLRASIVTLDDFFKSKRRNADYLEISDSQFSNEHRYFIEENFKGFSDYLTLGEGYSETGFLPYAVAIHISYLSADNSIRVKHFVSDSNSDTSDVAGKFAEALSKLAEWVQQHGIEPTIGIREFLDLHRRAHFPGLGYIKKLSIMHHIELVVDQIR